MHLRAILLLWLHTSVVCAFSVMNTVTLYGGTTVCFHSLVEGHLGGAQFGEIMDKCS